MAVSPSTHAAARCAEIRLDRLAGRRCWPATWRAAPAVHECLRATARRRAARLPSNAHVARIKQTAATARRPPRQSPNECIWDVAASQRSPAALRRLRRLLFFSPCGPSHGHRARARCRARPKTPDPPIGAKATAWLGGGVRVGRNGRRQQCEGSFIQDGAFGRPSVNDSLGGKGKKSLPRCWAKPVGSGCAALLAQGCREIEEKRKGKGTLLLRSACAHRSSCSKDAFLQASAHKRKRGRKKTGRASRRGVRRCPQGDRRLCLSDLIGCRPWEARPWLLATGQ